MVKVTRLPSGNYNAKVYDYTDETGKRHYKSFTDPDKKTVATLAANYAKDKAPASASRPDDITLEVAMERYVESKKNVLSPKTYREYTQTRKNSYSSIKKLKVFNLTQLDIQNEINIEAAKSSPKTVRNKHGLLSAALAIYRPDFVLHTTLPQKKKSEVKIPTEEIIIKLFERTKETDIELPVLLAATCGMRMSEIVGLRWKNINLKNKTMRICEAKVRDIDNNMVVKGTKTSAGTRTVHIFPQVLAALKRHYREGDEYITVLNTNNIYDRYQKVLNEINPDEHYTFHELRHYAVSVMLMLNIPKKYIADYVGHETENMIDQVYGHIMEDKKASFVDILENYYENLFENSGKSHNAP